MKQKMNVWLILPLASLVLALLGTDCKRRESPQIQEVLTEELTAAICSTTYPAQASDAEKRNTLKALLSLSVPECQRNFFSVVESVDERDADLFTSVFAERASCAHLKALVAYIADAARDELAQAQRIQEHARQGLADPRGSEERDVLRRYGLKAHQKLQSRLSSMSWFTDDDAITKKVRANAACMATDARSDMVSGRALERVHALLTLSFLAATGEPGFEAILATGLDKEEGLPFAAEALDMFKADAVFPLLKYYEKRAGLEEAKHAGTLIMMLPDTEAVYQRVLDATQHGAFFPQKDPKPDADGKVTLTLEDVMKRVDRWWGNLLREKYRGDKAFALYVMRHMPPRADGQVTSLFAAADPGVALEYYMARDPKTLSEGEFNIIWTRLLDEESGLAVQPRERLLAHMFDGLPETETEKRSYILHALSKCSLAFRQSFVTTHFKAMTPEERKSMLFEIGNLPQAEKQKAFGAIRPLCNASEVSIINYLLRAGDLPQKPAYLKGDDGSLQGSTTPI